MTLPATQRKQLLAESHRLKATIALHADQIDDNRVAHVRTALAGQRLVKVRINADNSDECDAAAAELARLIPCELVKRIGRVALLYQVMDKDRPDITPTEAENP